MKFGGPSPKVGGEIGPDDAGAAPAEGVGGEGEELGELDGFDTAEGDRSCVAAPVPMAHRHPSVQLMAGASSVPHRRSPGPAPTTGFWRRR